MGKIMRNDVEYGGGSGGGGDVSQLEQRVERLEDSVDDLDRYKVTQLTFNTGIDIGDWDRVIDPDEPVVYERYTNYHDAVAKLSQQIDIMGNRTDDLKTSLNDITKVETGTFPTLISLSSAPIVKKQNNKVIIQGLLQLANSVESTSNLNFGTLPTGFRPNRNIDTVCMYASGGVNGVCGVRVFSSGEFYILGVSGQPNFGKLYTNLNISFDVI